MGALNTRLGNIPWGISFNFQDTDCTISQKPLEISLVSSIGLVKSLNSNASKVIFETQHETKKRRLSFGPR